MASTKNKPLHQRLQIDLDALRGNVSIAHGSRWCALSIAAWVLLRRRPAAESPEPAKLTRLTEELDRNPEALAQILTLWINRSREPETRRPPESSGTAMSAKTLTGPEKAAVLLKSLPAAVMDKVRCGTWTRSMREFSAPSWRN